MSVGEVVELLICVRDGRELTRGEDMAVAAACNILAGLPCEIGEEEARAMVKGKGA